MRGYRCYFLAVFSLLAHPTLSAADCTREGLGPDCSLHGVVQIHSVDPERFLVAVDVEPTDGRGDHLFLFTGAAVSFDDPQTISGRLTFDKDQKLVAIHQLDGKQLHVDFDDASFSHYWGYRDEGGRMHALFGLREAATCDHVDGSCWEAEGWRIPFPR